MAGVITKRSEEDVRDWLVERIDKYQLDSEGGQEVSTLQSIKDNIQLDIMLSKAHMRVLELRLQQDATEELGRGNDSYHTAIQYIDRLSIYTDAWQMYCRPGTYFVRYDTDNI